MSGQTKRVYIKPSDGACQECGNVAELRPYGKGGKFICFKCGMANEPETARQFEALIGDADVTVLDLRVPSSTTEEPTP